MATVELRRRRLPASSTADDLISTSVAGPGREAAKFAGMARMRSPGCSLLSAFTACLLCVVDAQISTFNGELVRESPRPFRSVSDILLAKYPEKYLVQCIPSSHANSVHHFIGPSASIHAAQKMEARGSRLHQWYHSAMIHAHLLRLDLRVPG